MCSRFSYPKPSTGDLVAVESKGIFLRASVIDLIKFDDNGKPTDVTLKLLETGEVFDYKVS